MRYSFVLEVKEVKGFCPLYKVGDKIIIREFYIDSKNSENVCIHLLSAASTLLSAFLHGVSAVELGIGDREDAGYLQCPDPGPPYTKGGTVIFELRRKPLETSGNQSGGKPH
ncbi:MAG: TIGR04076 family protein [Thermoproteota archaeon]